MKDLLQFRVKRLPVLLFDGIAVIAAFIGAFLLRFDFSIPPEHAVEMWRALPAMVIIQLPVFYISGLYRGIWLFAGVKDLFGIVRASGLAVLLCLGYIAFENRLLGWPRSVFLLDAALLIFILGGVRFAYRFFREEVLRKRAPERSILILGAGQTANFIARELSVDLKQYGRIVGFLDDDPKLQGLRIHDATVLGGLSTFQRWLERKRIDEVIIAIPSLPGSKIKDILLAARARNIPCRICPPLRDVLLGHAKISHLREVKVEDLLRRDTVKVFENEVSQFLNDQVILITGAGGSIGSELCRQVAKYGPKKVIFYERSEYNLYRIEKEFKRSEQNVFVVGDILDTRKLQQVFHTHRPTIVLHAAAFKHVPIMEENVYEAIRNNVLGTYIVASVAAQHSVSRFVLISTDKAVRPTSVMGATKRMAELITTAIGKQWGLKASAVRFGNVLDSEGSVLPLFRAQINSGGPVTITHPDATRYFMTIPEASILVLQAACWGKGGEVFLLDMGKPIKIRELAEELITLSGQRPHEDIEIVYTGLRRGEKLHEELLSDIRNAEPTPHPKIVVSSRELAPSLPTHWESQLKFFESTERFPSERDLLAWIATWVPEYGTEKAPGATLPEGSKAHNLTGSA